MGNKKNTCTEIIENTEINAAHCEGVAVENGESVKQSSCSRSWFSRVFGFMWRDAGKRSWFVNMTLYALLVGAVFVLVGNICIVFNELQSAYRPGSGLWYELSHGFLYAVAICLISVVALIQLLRWRRSGLSWAFIGITLCCLSQAWVEYEFMFYFSIPTLLAIAALWGVLHIRKRGVSTWNLCAPTPIGLRVMDCVVAAMYAVAMLLPFPVGTMAGFDKNLYGNGMSVIDASLNRSPYYSYSLYQKVLLGDDYEKNEERRLEEADYWLNRAINMNEQRRAELSEREFKMNNLDVETSAGMLFIDDLVYELKTRGEESAKEILKGRPTDLDLEGIASSLDVYRPNQEFYAPYEETLKKIIHEQSVQE